MAFMLHALQGYREFLSSGVYYSPRKTPKGRKPVIFRNFILYSMEAKGIHVAKLQS